MTLSFPRFRLAWLLGAACIALASCGDDAREASIVQPVFRDTCRNVSCSDLGVCVEGGANAQPMCVCDSGYAGERCDLCDAEYHRDGAGRCLPDERCAEQPVDPCGLHGHCLDEDGIVSCECDLGHEGARCQLCAAGFARDGFGDCLQRVLADGEEITVPARCNEDTCHGHGQCSEVGDTLECRCYPGYEGARCDACAPGYSQATADRCVARATCASSDCGGCVTFDGGADFPAHPDTCTSRTELQADGMLLWSTGGEGAVWLCAQSTLYGLTTEHVMLEAGAVLPAEITFLSPIAALSFDYAAADEFALELLGDGAVIETLSAERRTQGSLSLTFDPPISLLAFHSSDEYAQTIAIDNLQFEPAVCQ